MYCKDCKSFFDKPKYMRDDPSPTGVSLTSGSYIYEVCPICGSDYITESKKCPSCGDDMHGDSVVCDDCKGDFAMAIEAVKDGMNIDDETFEALVAEYFEW